jgi:hypothetical protein
MRGKAKGKVDNNCQDNRTDDPNQEGAEVERDHCKGARRKRDNTNDNGSLRHGLGLNLEGKSHALGNGNREDERVEF